MAGKSALEAETNVLDDKWVKTVLEHPQIMCFTHWDSHTCPTWLCIHRSRIASHTGGFQLGKSTIDAIRTSKEEATVNWF